MIFTLGELFCGPGGLAYGAINAEIENKEYKIVHEWATDYDQDTCNTYIRNICHDNPNSVICEDVRKLNLDTLKPIKALAFGFPCNDFSVVGEQKGFNGTFGPLYTYGVKVLKKHEPLWFLAENVGGIRSANGGGALKKIFKDLDEAGYRIYPHLYKFEEYGVSQARHRVIIIGIRKDQPYEFKPPSPVPFKGIDNTCRKALEDPPIPEDAPNDDATEFELATVELFKNAFGFEAQHVGPIGLTPDVLILSDQENYIGIIDNKAYSKYTISNDHHNRMVHNYIQTYKQGQKYPLAFFSYIAGGFGKNINGQIKSIVDETKIHGSAMSVSNVIKLVDTYKTKSYDHARIRNIFSLDRQVLIADL